MTMMGKLIVVLFFAALVYWQVRQKKDESTMLKGMTDEQRKQYKLHKQAAITHGKWNPELSCDKCNTRGHVHSKPIVQKKGISGGKATAALMTAGTSMLVTGLSRKEAATEAFCTNCSSLWHY